ncbi:glycosyltransferase family 39 protein [Anaerolineales bacterium HSG25]|nr:glycosyltransferase family 39 protein [Anaerolineales bacterium HSG25]
MMRHQLKHHAPLAVILLLFSLLTIYQSATLPLGEAADETDHYQYLQFVARNGHPPLTNAERVEAGFKGGLAPLYYTLTAWPIALVGVDSQPDIRRTDQRPQRHIPTDGLGFNRVLHTWDEAWPWQGQPLAWHLVRLLSLPMAWLTIIATYFMAYRLVASMPHVLAKPSIFASPRLVAIGTALFIAFLPRFVISSAVINDDNLVFALSALILLLELLLLQGSRHVRWFVLLGILFGLALITKYFSLILIPELVLTLWFISRAGNVTIKRHILPFLVAIFLTAGPWFMLIIYRFNQVDELGWIAGLAASLGEPQITNGLVNLLNSQTEQSATVGVTYPFFDWLGLLYGSFWFEYGWMNIFAPRWIYISITIILFLTFLPWFIRVKTILKKPSPTTTVLTTRLALFLLVLLIRYILSATIDTGQGRHLYSALPVIALLVSWSGSQWLVYPKRKRRVIGHALPLLYCMVSLHVLLWPNYILSYYPVLPITSQSLEIATTASSVKIEFASGLYFRGFELPNQAMTGQTIPVTTYWQVKEPARQDYLLSLCLDDEQQRPVGCWDGHFINGNYPSRAWEVGDSIIDTVHIPLPACNRIRQTDYTLHVSVWPVRVDRIMPTLSQNQVLDQRYPLPMLSLQTSDSLLSHAFGTIDIRSGKQNIGQAKQWFEVFNGLKQHLSTNLPFESVVDSHLFETYSQIDYTNSPSAIPPMFQKRASRMMWLPVSTFQRALYMPCGTGSADEPYAQLYLFINDPTLSNGLYQHSQQPNLTLEVKNQQRTIRPITSSLSFGQQLTPRTMRIIGQPDLSMSTDQFIKSDSVAPLTTIRAGDTLPISIEWQTRQWMAEPLVVALKLLDYDFGIGGERVTQLGDRYPNVLWVPGEIIEESYAIPTVPHTPPGLYQLEWSLLRQDARLPNGFEYLPWQDGDTVLSDHLYPARVRLLDPAHADVPPQPLTAHIGDRIRLNGYEINQHGNEVSLALYWSNNELVKQDYTVFTQLLGPDYQVWAQWDNPPQDGRYPTSQWQSQDQVVDRYTLQRAEGAPAGMYHVLVGMYDPATGERLPISMDGQAQTDHAVWLGPIEFD